jgi:hypothetical protein
MAGMLLFQDGSPHRWLAGQAPCDLVVTMDDATSTVYSALLVEEEGTASSLLGLAEVISQHGLFSSFYKDSQCAWASVAGRPDPQGRWTG